MNRKMSSVGDKNETRGRRGYEEFGTRIRLTRGENYFDCAIAMAIGVVQGRERSLGRVGSGGSHGDVGKGMYRGSCTTLH